MILFWLICALFVVIALAFVLPPLLQSNEDAAIEAGRKEANLAVYRDQIAELEADFHNGLVSQEQYAQDREELEKRLLEDVATESPAAKPAAKGKAKTPGRGLVYAIAFGLPLLATLIYLEVGTRAALTGGQPLSQPAAPTAEGEGPMSRARIEANVASLAKRLEQNPNDAEGWIMLATSYSSWEKFQEASDAYAKAVSLKSNDVDLLVDYAFALAMSNNRKLEGKPAEQLQKALQLDPENPRALQLAGAAAYEAHNYEQAITHWEKLIQKTPPDSELGQMLTQRIADAKAATGRK